MMPGGSEEAYKRIEDILKPVSAQTNTGADRDIRWKRLMRVTL